MPMSPEFMHKIRVIPDPPKPPRDRGAGCWALADKRGAYWDGSRHVSGMPMTTILEERAYRFVSYEAASIANVQGFDPVQIL